MDRLHGISIYLRVVESGSLSAAARALGISTSAVSATLARLEEKLAVRLLVRTTRRLSMTDEGAEFYTRCKQITAALQEAETTIGRASRIPSGRLRVSMPSALGRNWIIPHLPDFAKKYPAVSLEVVCTDYVPYTMESGLDVSVQVGELQASGLVVRRLGSTNYAMCASPKYLSRQPALKVPEDLKRVACLTYRRPRNGRIREWRFREGTSVRSMAMDGFMTFNSGEALVMAAVAGLGVIQVAEYYARSQIEQGTLVEVLQEYAPSGYDVSVVFPQQQPMAPKLRVFVDFLVALFKTPSWSRARPV